MFDNLAFIYPLTAELCTGFKIIEITAAENLGFKRAVFLIIYISCVIATTLWCTILIVLRILIVIRAQRGEGGSLGEYRHVIELLIESSALHSVTLIIYVALEGSSNWASDYFNTLAAITTVRTGLPFPEYSR